MEKPDLSVWEVVFTLQQHGWTMLLKLSIAVLLVLFGFCAVLATILMCCFVCMLNILVNHAKMAELITVPYVQKLSAPHAIQRYIYILI